LKKILIPVLLLLALLSVGFWLLIRRGPAGSAPQESGVTFKIESFESGFLLHYADGQTPLRALRWLPPMEGGIQPVQVLTQSDRQRLALFPLGKPVSSVLVPRPPGVREGFFNFAELGDILLAPGDLAILLYRSADPTSGELPLILALDLNTQTLRWAHRAPGEHLALGGDAKEGAVFLYGASSPILRLPLALQKGEQLGNTPFRASVKAMDMPEEIKGLADLLPTSAWSFLAAHTGGLSSYGASKGWKHWPPTTGGPLTFSDARPTLAAAKGYWWQPSPGRILQVKADGTPVHLYDASALAPGEPRSRDGALLKLCGADPTGGLWFTLATPMASSPLATPEGQNPEQADSQEPQGDREKVWRAEAAPGGEASPADPEDWNA